MEHFHQRLENGLHVVGEYHPAALSLAAGYFVKTGARDEDAAVSGVSHFLEHMMFKGTARRSPEDVNREFDSMGAKYNAFTSQEMTVYYGSVLPRFQEPLLDLLSDMMRPALRQEDFDMEKKVIIEEISMYQDRPAFVCFDTLKRAYYNGHPLGQSILGSRESIEALTQPQMQGYFDHRYAPNNITLVLTGKFDWHQVLAQVQAATAHWRQADAPRQYPPVPGAPARLSNHTARFQRQHVAVMLPGYSAQDARRHAASLACSVVGAGPNSRLYWSLTHPGLAQAASLSHDASDGAGVFAGYLLVNPERTENALDTYWGVLAQACRGGVREDELERARRRLASAVALGAETPMGRLRPVGYNWVQRGVLRSPQDSLDELLRVSVQEVNEVLASLDLDRATVVTSGPLEGLNGFTPVGAENPVSVN